MTPAGVGYVTGMTDDARNGPAPDAPWYDVVVVGGAIAGLSAALVLGRSRRSVLVVDDGEPRNAASAQMHGYLSRDGVDPREFLRCAREEVARYGVELRADRAVEAHPVDGGFTVLLRDGGTVHARKMLVTTGMLDVLPQVDGMVERWGRDVLHCPYCHGWEVRDQALAVVAAAPGDVSKALMLTQWSEDVTLFLHTVDPVDVKEEQRDQLAAAGVRTVTGRVAALAVADDTLVGVRMQDGAVHPCDAVYVQPLFAARDDVLVGMGAEITEEQFGRWVRTDPTGATSIPGVWAAGNAATPLDQAVNAASTGYRAGQTINQDLLAERLAALTPAR